MDDQEFNEEVEEAYPNAPLPADNYRPNFEHERSAAHRRRVWSLWSVLVVSNHVAHNDNERGALTFLHTVATNRLFADPQLIRQFMRTQFPGDAGPLARAFLQRRRRGGYDADAYDGNHVFHQEFTKKIEYGLRRRGQWPHNNIRFRVLHDSMYRLDGDWFEYLYRREWNRAAEVHAPDYVMSDESARRMFLGVSSREDYAELEYEWKEYQQMRARGQDVPRADPRGYWSRRPLYADRARARGGEAALNLGGGQLPYVAAGRPGIN